MSTPESILYAYGYAGLFFAVLITSLSLFVGVPTFSYVSLAVAMGLDPILSSLVAAVAGALGETPAYVLGLGSKKLVERKYRDLIQRWEAFFRKYTFLAIVIIAALPFGPDEIAGFLAGISQYDYVKFVIATAIGKFIKYVIAAYTTLAGIDVISSIL